MAAWRRRTRGLEGEALTDRFRRGCLIGFRGYHGSQGDGREDTINVSFWRASGNEWKGDGGCRERSRRIRQVIVWRGVKLILPFLPPSPLSQEAHHSLYLRLYVSNPDKVVNCKKTQRWCGEYFCSIGRLHVAFFSRKKKSWLHKRERYIYIL